MTAISSEATCESLNDQYPLLWEQNNNFVNEEHIIDMERGDGASISDSSNFYFSQNLSSNHDERTINSTLSTLNGPSSSFPTQLNSRNSFLRRSERIEQHNWSPFNSGFWISVELIFTLGLIIASIIVLYLSRHEHPRAHLFAWVVVYTAGCFASLPVFYWRFLHCNEVASQASEVSSHRDSILDQNPCENNSLSRSSGQENRHRVSGAPDAGQTLGITNCRIGIIMDKAKTVLNCFFAVWFIVGNIWIFGGRASAAEAPYLYRLCLVYLTFSCIGYAMPFILCAMICCCLPCIITFLGVREELSQVQGASDESINALPTYKFKVKNDEGCDTGEHISETGGEIVAKETEDHYFISGEDAVCCICLARYMDDDELRGMPCSHFFHAGCVDQWLKINATCPLCKIEISEIEANSPSQPNSLSET